MSISDILAAISAMADMVSKQVQVESSALRAVHFQCSNRELTEILDFLRGMSIPYFLSRHSVQLRAKNSISLHYTRQSKHACFNILCSLLGLLCDPTTASQGHLCHADAPEVDQVAIDFVIQQARFMESARG
jgi:hypothetical protein